MLQSVRFFLNEVTAMPWIQIKLYATAKSANKLSNMLMGQGAQAVTYMDAHDNPVYEPLPGETKL